MRQAVVVVAAILSLSAGAVVAAPASAVVDEGASGQSTTRGISYEVLSRGSVQTDPAAFRSQVRTILTDARGWSLGGSVRFGEVSSGGDLRVILASPEVVGNAHEVCDRNFSCRVGNSVYINDERWRSSTNAFRNAGGDLTTYRHYLINHEVGHVFGFGHRDCPGAGATAPVMRQQSIDLQGCQPNAHPVDVERRALSEQLGVPIHDWVFIDVLVGDVHQRAIHAIAEAEVAAGYADGTFRPRERVSRAQMATFLTRALGLEAQGEASFDDVPADHPHAEAIAAVAEAGIAQGFDDGTFRPQDPVARGQMATMLAAAYDLDAEGPPPFDDVPEHHTHATAIAAVAEAEIAQGHRDGTYRPGSSVSRAQMASFLVRAGVG